MSKVTVLVGDVREALKGVPDEHFHTVVTSPPYWGLRDYRAEGMIGLEDTFDAHLAELVKVFREVRRVLRKDGTVWLNYGSTYASGQAHQPRRAPAYDTGGRGLLGCPVSDCVCSGLCGGCQDAIRSRHGRTADTHQRPGQLPRPGEPTDHGSEPVGSTPPLPSPPGAPGSTTPGSSPPPPGVCSEEQSLGVSDVPVSGRSWPAGVPQSACRGCGRGIGGTSGRQPPSGCRMRDMGPSSLAYGSLTIAPHKPKDLMLLPAYVAEALRADGWWLRSEIVWAKPNPMPESVTDRPTSSHEKLFLLSRSPRYFYDAEAVRLPPTDSTMKRKGGPKDPRDGNRSMRKALENLRTRTVELFPEAVGPVEEEAKGPRNRATFRGEGEGEGTPYANQRNPGFRTGASYVDQAGAQDNSAEAEHQKGRAARNPAGFRPGGYIDHQHDARVPQGASTDGKDYGPGSLGVNLRNVWHIPTFSYPEAHFATFPPRLVEPCIKAGTSEHGCCGECGAPWTRKMDTAYTKATPNGPEKVEMGVKGYTERMEKYTTTVGWEPGCECGASVVPCRVLDPFGGAGTTAMVADRLGRDATLVEINPDYAEQAAERIRGDAGLFANVEKGEG